MTRNLDRDRNRGQDVTAWGISDAGHPAPLRIDENGDLYVAAFDQVAIIDEKLRVINNTYLQAIAEGDVPNHTPWSKIGYIGNLVANTEADLWSAGGVISFPTSSMQMEMLSSSANDTGSGIKTGTCDAGGGTRTLYDAAANFLAATAVAAGDCVVLDQSGITPEWGYVTTVVNANTLAIAGGFSSGGEASAGRTYGVYDFGASTGAHLVKIDYLDGDYIPRSEICMLNGTNVVGTNALNIYRVNSFRVIAAGTGNKAAGNISLRNLANTPVYSYITANYTRARNSAYTVPYDKTLYVVQFTVSYGNTHTQPHYCRLYTRANVEPATLFNTNNIFYPYSEVICANSSQEVTLEMPTRLPARTDIKVSAIADYAGIATSALRGWLADV